MSSQNTTEVFRKHLMTKKVRIKAWQENGDSATNMTNRLGREGPAWAARSSQKSI
jgi:hypothetical protein